MKLPTFVIVCYYIFIVLSVALCHPIVPPDSIADREEFKYNSSDLPFFTSWPLKAGFPGLIIENINEYLSQFPLCLVAVFNPQGIEMIEWPHPIYLYRYDIAVKEIVDSDDNKTYNNIYDFPFGKSPILEDTKHKTLPLSNNLDVPESKWTCYVHFDLFYPEKSDAFHFYFRSRPQAVYGKYYDSKFLHTTEISLHCNDLYFV